MSEMLERAKRRLKDKMRNPLNSGGATFFNGVSLTEFTKEELIDIFSVTLADRDNCPRCGK